MTYVKYIKMYLIGLEFSVESKSMTNDQRFIYGLGYDSLNYAQQSKLVVVALIGVKWLLLRSEPLDFTTSFSINDTQDS